MSAPKEKTDFAWEEGCVLDDKNTDPVPEVRAKGLPKLNQAVHADPVKRKEDRDKKILNIQSKLYQHHKNKTSDDAIIIEESQSGLSQDMDDRNEAERLIDKGNRFKGLDRFGQNKKTEE